MREIETVEIELALRSERVLEPSKFDTFEERLGVIHSRLAELAITRAAIDAEWAELQDQQSELIAGHINGQKD